jgi:hypothetical protein
LEALRRSPGYRMSAEIEIRGEGATVRVDIRDYERSDPKNIDDANWLVGRCSVQVKGFSCDLKISPRTYDLAQFQSELRSALTKLVGSARFSTLEPGLELEVKFKRGGKAEISGVAQTAGPQKTKLYFAFDTDQTFLSETDRQLHAVIERFPEKGGGIRKPW